MKEAENTSLILPPIDLIEVGKIDEPYGLKGGVKVFPYNNRAEKNNASLLNAKKWWLFQNDIHFQLDVLIAKFHSKSIIAFFANLTSRDAIENLKGSRVFISRADFPLLNADEYYWADLIGLEVINAENENLGQVINLIDNGAHSLICVAKPKENFDKERLIPFVDVYIKHIDFDKKKILVDWKSDY